MSTAAVLRIGVTGHRDVTLPPAILTRLRGALDSAFSALKQGAVDMQSGTDGGRQGLQVISALAEGADHMLADAGLAQGAALVAVLPFPRAVYLQDFPVTSPAEATAYGVAPGRAVKSRHPTPASRIAASPAATANTLPGRTLPAFVVSTRGGGALAFRRAAATASTTGIRRSIWT